MRAGQLCDFLASEGHSVSWWTSSFDHQQKEFLTESSRQIKINEQLTLEVVHSTPGYNRNISISRFINHRNVAKTFSRIAASKEKPDCIFACLPTIDLAHAALVYGTKHKIPVVIDLRDKWPEIFETAVPKPARWMVRALLRSQYAKAKETFSKCDHLIAISSGYLTWANSFSKRSNDKASSVIPLGYEGPKTTRGQKRKSEEKVAFFSGTLGFSYDIETLIDAAKILDRTHPEIKFRIAGKGEKEALFKKSSVPKNITFLGWIGRNEIEKELANCDLGLSCYAQNATQTIPNKPIEYMAFGLPQVSSLKGELSEILRETQTGLTYEAGSASDLANCISRTVENLDERTSIAARRFYTDNFDLSLINKRLLNAINEAVVESRKA